MNFSEYYYNGGTNKMKDYKKTIAKIKAYEANGLPEYLRSELRGIRRNLETEFDKEKEEKNKTYQEACWN